MSVETIEKKKLNTDINKKEKIKFKKPSLYRILLHNNDVTSFQAVIKMLKDVFLHSEQKATQIMLEAHRNKRHAQCYDYTSKKIAEEMKTKAEEYCQLNQELHPYLYDPQYDVMIPTNFKYLVFSIEEIEDNENN